MPSPHQAPVARPAEIHFSGGSLFFLALLGATAARAGGSPVWKSVARVTFWGALAMALTAGVGALFGAQL
jgi:vacuolar iron transporter family protein